MNSNVCNKRIDSSNNPIKICPGCGNRDDVHYRLILRKKRSSSKSRLIKKFLGHSVYEEKVPVQKKLNPAKAYNLFYTTETPIRKPILSLPKLERDDIGVSIRLAIELLRKTFRLYELPLKIGLLIFEKYSQVKEKIEFVYNFIIQGYEVLMESVESASRDNWDRSLIDWISIYDTAEKESNYHASRVHFAVTSKGKKKYMSPKHISQTKPRIKKFINKYKKYVPFYELFVDFILYISEKDPQIHKISREMELNYMREKIPQLLDNYKNTLIEVQGNTKGIFKRQDKHNSNYTKKEGSNSNYYQYVEFRHPNKLNYMKQKSRVKRGKRKANPDGWRYCCIRKLDDLPQNVAEYILDTTVKR